MAKRGRKKGWKVKDRISPTRRLFDYEPISTPFENHIPGRRIPRTIFTRPNRHHKTQVLRTKLIENALSILNGADGVNFRFNGGLGRPNLSKLAEYIVKHRKSVPYFKREKLTFGMVRKALGMDEDFKKTPSPYSDT